MSSPTQELQAFAQSVYLTTKKRYFDDITSTDGQNFVQQTVDWANMFLDELENEVDTDGKLVDWWFAREAAFELGSATLAGASVSIPSTVDRLITDEERYVQVKQGDSVVSNWLVVHPRDISSKTDRITDDMCAVVGTNLVFSRAFRDTEAGGTIVGDVMVKLPRLTYSIAAGVLTATNTKALVLVRPKQLLVFGVAKNVTLPDVVQGKLSPNYTQKFTDLLQGAIARSNASSVAGQVARDGFGGVRGIY